MKHKEMSRSSFLKRALAVSAAAALPSILTSSMMPDGSKPIAKGKLVPASRKVNLACCGIGRRGGEIIRDLYATGLANIVALCDVDMGAKPTKAIMDMFPDVPRFQDFREMFEKMGDQIDAVSVGVPDHSHFPICMLAMSKGIHVYVEKPLARTFHEVELLMKAEKKHGVVTQMGNQGHSGENYFQFKAWKEAGIIKDVTAITAHMNSARRWHGWNTDIKSFPSAQSVPKTLDWNCWLAAAQFHDFNKDFIDGQWRCWYDFGMGALGDWGAHIIDTAHEFLELGLPVEVEPLYIDGHNSFFFPQASTICFRFPARGNMPPVDITWYEGVKNVPTVPQGYGTSDLDPNIPPVGNGQIQPSKLNPGKIIYSKELTFKGGSHSSKLSIIPAEKAKEMADKLPVVPDSPSNHYKNFLLACQGQEKTRSPFSISGPLSQVFCLGVIAQKMNAKIVFDPGKKRIVNNEQANAMLVGDAPRPEWEKFYEI